MTPKRPGSSTTSRACNVGEHRFARATNAPGIAAGTRRRVLEAVEACEFRPQALAAHQPERHPPGGRRSGRQRLATSLFIRASSSSPSTTPSATPRASFALTYDDLAHPSTRPVSRRTASLRLWRDRRRPPRAPSRSRHPVHIPQPRHGGELRFVQQLRDAAPGRHLLSRLPPRGLPGLRRQRFAHRPLPRFLVADRGRLRDFDANVYRADEIAAVDESGLFAARRATP